MAIVTDQAARALLHTVVGNLIDKGGADPKFRRIKDAAVTKRCEGEAYTEATQAFEELGFVCQTEEETKWWSFQGALEGEVLSRLSEARERFKASDKAVFPAFEVPVLQTPASTICNSSIALRPEVLKVATPNGPLCILAYPDVTCVKLVGAANHPSWAAGGSGKPTQKRPRHSYDLDYRMMLTVYNDCPDLAIATHFIDSKGVEQKEPDMVTDTDEGKTLSCKVQDHFTLRLDTGRHLVCGFEATERPHCTGGHLVVLVTRDPAPAALNFALLDAQCREIIDDVGEDKRETSRNVQLGTRSSKSWRHS